ncbi:MAG: sugar transferase [Candidatus Omnitrophota bacterium]
MLKRLFDIFLSFFGLCVFSPVWIIISFLIWYEDKGPVLFFQDRVGKNGKIFKMVKFRSMIKDAEAKTLGLRDKELPQETITKVGRFLRNTALDELPQLINILSGEMSFVGPRATLKKEIDVLPAKDRQIKLSVKPGLTGIAQIYGRDDISAKQRVRFDKIYIKKKNFCFDLKLILLSVFVTLCARWKEKKRKL